jgi:hypothetical protein
MRVSRRSVGLACLVSLLVAGCEGQGPTATLIAPSQPASMAWSRGDIALPADVVEVAPGSTPGMVCSPCHARQASLLFGITAADDQLLAVGIQQPPSEAIAYVSADDGRTWTAEPGFAPGADTGALAVAADGDGRVIVGRRGREAAAWAATDGGWQAAPPAASLQGPAGGSAELRAVVPWRGQWVAVGSADEGADRRVAAIWASPDGLAWERVSHGSAFTDRVAYGIAGSDERLVVVGSLAGSDGATATPGVAWTSDDGAAWSLVEAPALAGPMRAVTHTDRGFVAVGFGIEDDRAAAWTSPDGSTWSAVPDQQAFKALGKPVRMSAVGWDGTGLVAAGWKWDAGNGSGVVWRSPDGSAWVREPDQASMSGASLAGVAFADALPIVVGTSGYPDNDQASAWHEATATPGR